jgi:hypothetical protein
MVPPSIPGTFTTLIILACFILLVLSSQRFGVSCTIKSITGHRSSFLPGSQKEVLNPSKRNDHLANAKASHDAEISGKHFLHTYIPFTDFN